MDDDLKSLLDQLDIKDINHNLVNNNIMQDYTLTEYMLSIYIGGGLSMQELVKYTMEECNTILYANQINSYQEYEMRLANKVKS